MSEPLVQTSFLEDPPPRKGEYPIPEAARMEYCQSCGAAVVWTKTENDRSMPLSAASIVWRGEQRWALSHFADCEDAKEWRRG